MLRFTRFQLAVHIGALIPFFILLVDAVQNNLTVNPIQAIEQRTGQTAAILLLISLACTPLNTLFGFRPAIKARRPLGLYTFFYASIHFLTFIGLDYGFNFKLILTDVGTKRYILVGLSALTILIPLAITSTRGWMKRLGKTWQRLHRFVYLAGLLVIVHYIWAVKSTQADSQPLIFAGVLIFLLSLRLTPIRKWVIRHRQPLIDRIRSITPGPSINPPYNPPPRTGTRPNPGLK